jgi:hypothetical protein
VSEPVEARLPAATTIEIQVPPEGLPADPPARPLRTLWELWSPPLDPPIAGGLPYEVAQSIVAAWWDADPYECMALVWEAYAGLLDPEPAVTAVSTGAQAVTYAGGGGGPFGVASARAAWFRSRAGTGGTIPLHLVG